MGIIRGVFAVLAVLSSALAAPSAALAKKGDVVEVQVRLIAEPPPAEQMAEREVLLGEPVLQQKLRAIRSATLLEDVPLWGSERLEKGDRLILAQGVRGGSYFCGQYRADLFGRLVGQKALWACFLDREGDGRFDAAYTTNSNYSIAIPTFDKLTERSTVSAPYLEDANDARDYFEIALFHQKSFDIYDLLWFFMKVRRQGATEWRDAADTSVGFVGYFTNVLTKSLPMTLSVLDVTFEVKAKTERGAIVRPIRPISGLWGLYFKTLPPR